MLAAEANGRAPGGDAAGDAGEAGEDGLPAPKLAAVASFPWGTSQVSLEGCQEGWGGPSLDPGRAAGRQGSRLWQVELSCPRDLALNPSSATCSRVTPAMSPFPGLVGSRGGLAESTHMALAQCGLRVSVGTAVSRAVPCQQEGSWGFKKAGPHPSERARI